MLHTQDNFMEKLYWLNENKPMCELSNLQIQKFCFFYEMFQLVEGKDYNIDYLKAYANGPVYSNVYGDYYYRKDAFLNKIYNSKADVKKLCVGNLKKTLFLIETMTDKELSQLTHELDLWKSKEQRLLDGEKQIPILKSDITNSDEQFIALIKEGINIPKNYKVIPILDKRFVFDENTFLKLKNKHYMVLEQLSRDNELINPVYVEIDNEGVLVVD